MAYRFKSVSALISSDVTPGWATCMDLSTEFSPIAESAKMIRSWNGSLMNLAPQEFRLYRVTLTCDGDMVPPTLSHLWPGEKFSLVPSAEFSEPTSKPQQRPAYSGSLRTLGPAFTSNGANRRFYRPILDLMVTEPWRVTTREHDKSVSWQLVAEEYEMPDAPYGAH